MLASLTIKNVVLIDQLTIDFKSGLCALTGETGAGKSILLGSLGLALGARSDAGLVRHGSDQASVSAEFIIPEDSDVLTFLKTQELESSSTLILRRSVTKEGRSRAFINDQAVSVTLLKKVGEMLVEIHGQFETQSLLHPRMHRRLVDDYGTPSEKLQALMNIWENWKAGEVKLLTLREKMDKARTDEEYLRTSLEDLDALSVEAGEEEKLSTLKNKLMRRDQILENLKIVQSGIDEIEALSANVWRALEKLGEEGQDSIVAMDRVNVEIQELISSLQKLSHDIENSEYSLSEIDDRLFALKTQARKHDCTIDELSQKRNEIAEALNTIEDEDSSLAELIKTVQKNKDKYVSLAERISLMRQKSAEKLSQLTMKELVPLKLEKARFEISVKILPEEQWNEWGMDEVRFLVATNLGAEAGALNKVASGGELARLMLALKVVLAEVGSAGSLVFDEVDSGVGGATAAAVGERLAKLADHKQILVVTHSPQVAAMAQNHLVVTKGGQKEVKTNIVQLETLSDRQEEIARMLSGAEITVEARAAADKLLEAKNITKSTA
jgi:DNA repair protein RecN (Recombination protein N)